MLVYLGLGTNMGNREDLLLRGVSLLSQRGLTIGRVSDVFQTAPVGLPHACGLFLNAAIEAETTESPEMVLRLCLDVEAQCGRVRSGIPASRPLDIDLLLYGDCQCTTSVLTIPHPRMHLRRFVLIPLVQLVPKRLHPTLNVSFSDLLKECTDSHSVEWYSSWPPYPPPKTD